MSETPQERFVETLGLIFHADGSPPISGRILGHLVLADAPCSLTEIAAALDVSKASVSTNVRLLEARGIAVREARKGSREDYWRAEPRPHRATIEILSVRFRRNSERIDEIAETFPDDQTDQRARVVEFADFYRHSAEFLTQWAATLDARDADQTTGTPIPTAAQKDPA